MLSYNPNSIWTGSCKLTVKSWRAVSELWIHNPWEVQPFFIIYTSSWGYNAIWCKEVYLWTNSTWNGSHGTKFLLSSIAIFAFASVTNSANRNRWKIPKSSVLHLYSLIIQNQSLQNLICLLCCDFNIEDTTLSTPLQNCSTENHIKKATNFTKQYMNALREIHEQEASSENMVG